MIALRVSLLALAASACTYSFVDGEPPDPWDEELGRRVVDYNAALRAAALRLTGDLPTLAEIDAVAGAPDAATQKLAYEGLLRDYLARPAFARQIFHFWQDALKMGDTAGLDSAPAFLAQLVVEDRSFLEAFTATAGTCPQFDLATATFTALDCANNVTEPAGLLTHPGVNSHFYSNLAFRRVRWVQETFVCTRFPAELAEVAQEVGGASPYTGTFPFASIAGGPDARVDFLSVSSVTCANCHSTMNHVAPLFAHFDFFGNYSDAFVVPVPIEGFPTAELRDYLPEGEPTAWRAGVSVTGMASLGAAIAADPDVATCAVARLWNWALGKDDIVDTLAQVPAATIQAQLDAFVANGHRVRDAIYDVFTSDDFIRF